MLAVVLILAALALYFIFDRTRFHGSGKGARGLRPTQEVFRDPVSGRQMRVYEDPESGEREYRPSADETRRL